VFGFNLLHHPSLKSAAIAYVRGNLLKHLFLGRFEVTHSIDIEGVDRAIEMMMCKHSHFFVVPRIVFATRNTNQIRFIPLASIRKEGEGKYTKPHAKDFLKPEYYNLLLQPCASPTRDEPCLAFEWHPYNWDLPSMPRHNLPMPL